MPLLEIRTNVDLAPEERRALLDTASVRTAELLGKPESYVMVIVECGMDLRFGGSADPACLLTLKSLGLPEERTPEITRALSALMNECCTIPANRVYVEFASPPRHMWGFDNTTFG